VNIKIERYISFGSPLLRALNELVQKTSVFSVVRMIVFGGPDTFVRVSTVFGH
jgi:hypothetical protein